MKTILITGATRGIGQALCRRFVQGGWRVYGCARHLPREPFPRQEEAFRLVRADVSDAASVDALFEHLSRDGIDHLDALVNNAGISYVGLLQSMEESDWDRVIDTNLKGAFLCCRRALPGMIRQQKGAIINISSMWGAEGASCETAYSASKGGLDAFTKALAKETAPSHITVNAILCGVMDTSMNSFLSEEEKHDLIGQIGAGRMGRPEEAAELAYFLASGKADYMTGALIPLDGGFTG